MVSVFLSLIIVLIAMAGLLIGRRSVQARRRRIAAYRQSPESHILNLHD